MKEAILKSIEGGWNRLDLYRDTEFWKTPDITHNISRWGEIRFDMGDGYYDGSYLSFEEVSSDKRFWEALGRRLNWKPTTLHDFPTVSVVSTHYTSKERIIEGWVYQWHRFIDSLASGEEPETFFDNLLKK